MTIRRHDYSVSCCSTRFSIDASLVAGVKNARFHCSRCGHYFETPTAELKQKPAKPESSVENKSLTTEASADYSAASDASASDASASDASASDASASDASMSNRAADTQAKLQSSNSDITRSDASSIDEYSFDDTPLPRAENDSTSVENSTSDDDTISAEQLSLLGDRGNDEPERQHLDDEDITVTASWPVDDGVAPHEVDANSAEDLNSTSSYAPPPVASWPTEPSTQFERRAEMQATSEPHTGNALRQSATEPSSSFGSALPCSGGGSCGARDCSMTILKSKSSFVNAYQNKRFRRRSSSPQFSMHHSSHFFPEADFGYGVRISTKHRKRLQICLSSAQEHLPRVPPDSISVTELDSRELVLEGGTTVLEVSGVVENADTKGFKDIRVEARLYDEQSKLLQERVVEVANGLGPRAALTALDLEAIDRLQRERALAARPLMPNKNIPFRVIFTEDIEGTTFFSAQVYSVREAR